LAWLWKKMILFQKDSMAHLQTWVGLDCTVIDKPIGCINYDICSIQVSRCEPCYPFLVISTLVIKIEGSHFLVFTVDTTNTIITSRISADFECSNLNRVVIVLGDKMPNHRIGSSPKPYFSRIINVLRTKHKYHSLAATTSIF